jgi:hypothetical protein
MSLQDMEIKSGIISGEKITAEAGKLYFIHFVMELMVGRRETVPFPTHERKSG